MQSYNNKKAHFEYPRSFSLILFTNRHYVTFYLKFIIRNTFVYVYSDVQSIFFERQIPTINNNNNIIRLNDVIN